MEESIFGPRETRKKLDTDAKVEVQPLKEAMPEGGSITVLFCHAECTQS
jgi:hypothetical protein